MIFVTVGAQLPFNRLVRVVDEWARLSGRSDVFAQIGKTSWKPSYIHSTAFLKPDKFRYMIESADIVIAHTGMGSIISALELCKPILVMPRKAALKETRNDHQIATARRFLEMKYVSVAFDEKELQEKLNNINDVDIKNFSKIGSTASPKLIKTIHDFIENSPRSSCQSV